MAFSHKKYQNFNDKLKKASLQSIIKSYSGEYKKDLFNGKGRLEFIDGSIYEGEFKSNKINARLCRFLIQRIKLLQVSGSILCRNKIQKQVIGIKIALFAC